MTIINDVILEISNLSKIISSLVYV